LTITLRSNPTLYQSFPSTSPDVSYLRLSVFCCSDRPAFDKSSSRSLPNERKIIQRRSSASISRRSGRILERHCGMKDLCYCYCENDRQSMSSKYSSYCTPSFLWLRSCRFNDFKPNRERDEGNLTQWNRTTKRRYEQQQEHEHGMRRGGREGHQSSLRALHFLSKNKTK
jgi:hypothetical protein